MTKKKKKFFPFSTTLLSFFWLSLQVFTWSAVTGQPNETHCNPDNVHLKTLDCSKLLHLNRMQQQREVKKPTQSCGQPFFFFFFLFLSIYMKLKKGFYHYWWRRVIKIRSQKLVMFKKMTSQVPPSKHCLLCNVIAPDLTKVNSGKTVWRGATNETSLWVLSCCIMVCLSVQ